jgi:regulator of sigma E protease
MSDRFISLDGKSFTDTESIIAYLKEINYRPITIKYQRDDQLIDQSITPQKINDSYKYGFGIQNLSTVSVPWYAAPWFGLQYTGLAISQTASGFWSFISNLFSTGKILSDVSGPIGIAVFTNQVRQIGAIAVVQFIAILSISLAFINIMPFPALDGGRALFIIIGRIRQRPINQSVESYFHATGFYLLIILLLLISYRDISNLGLIARLKDFFQ